MIGRGRVRAASLAAWAVLVLAGGGSPSAAQSPDRPALRLLRESAREADEGNLAAALRGYENIVRQFPESLEAPEALLRIARAQLDRRNAEPAGEAARKLVDGYPRSPQAAGGWVVLGEIEAERARDPRGLEQARNTLRNAWLLFDRVTYPALESRARARVLSAELALGQGAVGEAAASYLAVIEDEVASPWGPPARVGLGSALLAQGEWESAAEMFQSALDRADEPQADGGRAIEVARRRLTLIHRLAVRPAAGEERWQRARALTLGDTLKRPVGVAARDDGRLAIADDAGELVLADPEGGVAGRFRLPGPERPSWDRDGELAAISAGEVRLPVDGGSRSFVDPDSSRGEPLKKVRSIERGFFGDWLVLAAKPDRVLRYASDLAPQRALVGPSSDPQDLARDLLGRIYVLDGKTGRVARFDPGGAEGESVAAGRWKKAEAIAVDAAGNLYVLDRDTSRVDVLSPAGGAPTSLGPLLPGGIELRSPQDVAVDGSGRVFIADSKLNAVLIVE